MAAGQCARSTETKDETKADVEIHHLAIDRMINVGGEVLAATVHRGAVRLRGRVGNREDIRLIERLLREADDVTGVDAPFAAAERIEPVDAQRRQPAPRGRHQPTRA